MYERKFGREAAEQRRSEKDPRDDLANDRGLSDRSQRKTKKTADDNDSGKRQQEVKDGVRRGACRRRCGARYGSWCRRAQRFTVAADEQKQRDAAKDHAYVGGAGKPQSVAFQLATTLSSTSTTPNWRHPSRKSGCQKSLAASRSRNPPRGSGEWARTPQCRCGRSPGSHRPAG